MTAVNWFKWTTRGWQVVAGAWHAKHTERAEEARLVDGLEQLQRVDSGQSMPIVEAPDTRACPCCSGRRCWAWRSSKHTHGCGGHTEEEKCWRSDEEGIRASGCAGMGEPLPVGVGFLAMMDAWVTRPGRHTLQYVVQHWVPAFWNPIPLRTRVKRWPAAAELRFGRPIQLGRLTRVVAIP